MCHNKSRIVIDSVLLVVINMKGVKEKMKKKKELIISIAAIVVLVLAIVGVSFAAFNYSRTGSTVNTITTGAISMTLSETSNVINIDGLYVYLLQMQQEWLD